MDDSLNITIKIFSLLQLKLGFRDIVYSRNYSEDTDPPNVLMLIEWLQKIADSRNLGVCVACELLEEDGSIRQGTLLLINGKNVIHADGVRTKVAYGSILSVFPPSGGG
jgi:molybdopterin converting factor small subunit